LNKNKEIIILRLNLDINISLEIRRIKSKGMGVFAAKDFNEGEIIEICPIIVLPEEETKLIDKTKLCDYYYGWGTNFIAIALGYGSLYNHSYEPNAAYEKDFEKNIIIFKCLRLIKKGEEITINYNGNPFDKKPVWFEISKE